MPIYEYQCRQCGHRLEILQKISDPPPADCPECRRPALKKLVSAASFRLKGGGWYETDFKQSGRRPAEGADGEKDEEGKAKDKEGKEGKKDKEGKAGKKEGKKDKTDGAGGKAAAREGAAGGGKGAAGSPS